MAKATKEMWERGLPLWHGVVLFSLLATLLFTLTLVVPRNFHAGVVILSALLIPWYMLSLRFDTRQADTLWIILYYLVGWSIWFVLTLISMIFYLLLFVLYPHPFMNVRMPLAVVPVVLLAIFSVLRGLLLPAGLSLEWFIFTLIGMPVALTIGGFVWVIIYESKERQKVIDKLEATRAELAEAEHEAGIRKERERLAHEIHDTLTQGFTSIIMYLEAARGDPENRATIDSALAVARDSLREARRFVHARQPQPLEALSLPEALRQTVTAWSAQTGIQAIFEANGGPVNLTPSQRHALLRILQEALANVHQHAEASRVNVTLSTMPDRVLLDIIDDGRGFDISDTGDGSFGIQGMRRRAADVGGDLVIESQPGKRTILTVDIPIEEV